MNRNANSHYWQTSLFEELPYETPVAPEEPEAPDTKKESGDSE